MQIPDMPRPVKVYNNEQPSLITPNTNKSLHTKRFQYKGTEKLDVRVIKYDNIDQVGYFANKEKVKKEQEELKRR